MKKTLQLLLIILLFLPNCNNTNEENKIEEDKSDNFQKENPEDPLGIISLGDTLKISLQLSECGEWGGSREAIYVYKSKRNVFARFIMDTVTCSKIVTHNGASVLDDKYRAIVLDTVKQVSLDEQKLINNFLQRLFQLCLEGDGGSNSGDVYEIEVPQKDLKFSYWNCSYRDTYYLKARNPIFAQIIKSLNLKGTSKSRFQIRVEK